MREIKFRAWDIKRKEWISTCNMVMSLHGKEFYWNFGYEPLKDINRNEFILSQFTGLKDKNGKEIYEGDVVKIKDYYCNKGIFKFSQGGYGIREIDNNGIYSIENLKIRENILLEVEIIGNIYENPELIR